MDGSAFERVEVDAGAPLAPAPTLQACGLALASPAPVRDRARHWLSVACAAALHVAMLAAVLPNATDAFGDAGVALEAIAVSIVDAVPVISAPEAMPLNGRPLPDEQVPSHDMSEASESTAQAPAAETAQPKPSLALDLPVEPVQDEALSLPAREPDVKRYEEPVVVDQSPGESEVEARTERTEIAAAESAPPRAPAALVSVSAAEASPGEILAYAKRLVEIVERHKPSSRQLGGYRGRTVVSFLVTDSGKAETIVVMTSSGNARLDQLALSTVENLQFPPPPPGISARDREIRLPFVFNSSRQSR